jgi:hypothetical protein
VNQRDLESGELNHLKGQYLAYFKGELVAYGSSSDEVISKLTRENYGSMIQKVGTEPVVVRFRRPRRIIG